MDCYCRDPRRAAGDMGEIVVTPPNPLSSLLTEDLPRLVIGILIVGVWLYAELYGLPSAHTLQLVALPTIGYYFSRAQFHIRRNDAIKKSVLMPETTEVK